MSAPQGRTGNSAVEPGPTGGTEPRRPAGWVLGGVVFAATAMALVGFFQVVEGLAALFDADVYLVDPGRLFPGDLEVLGVVHLVIGVVLLAAGLSLRTARRWARLTGIAFASLSAVTHFLFVPYAPVWSLTIIALDVVVIGALCRYRWDVAPPDRRRGAHG